MKYSLKTIITILAIVTISIFSISCDGGDPSNLNDQVIWLGDSIFALSGATADYLEELTGQRYREYYVSGADMINGAIPFVPTIREQFDNAFDENPNVRTLIMDGGGNDVLISNKSLCSSDWRYSPGANIEEAEASLDPGCIELLDDIRDAFEEMSTEGFNKGVEKGIYMCVYYLNMPELDAVGKYGWDMAHLDIQQINRDINADDTRRVVFVDPRDEFWGKDGLITSDNIHPSDAGSKILANVLHQAMVDNCIEQDAGCVPVPVDNGL